MAKVTDLVFGSPKRPRKLFWKQRSLRKKLNEETAPIVSDLRGSGPT